MKKHGVVITFFGGEQAVNLFEKCITSLSSQTVKDFKAYVYFDGVAYNIRQMCEKILEQYLWDKGVPYETYGTDHYTFNRGVCYGRNLAIFYAAEAGHPFVKFLDYDDRLEPTYFEEIDKSIASHPDKEVWYTGYIKQEATNGKKEIVTALPYDYQFLNDQLYILYSTMVVRKELLQRVKDRDGFYFDEGLEFGEDIDFLIRALNKTNAIALNGKPLVRYIFHEQQRSRLRIQMFKALQYVRQKNRKRFTDVIYEGGSNE